MDKGIFLSQVRSVYQNVENNRFPKFRGLRDSVTDAYVETFMSDENDLMEMVNFILSILLTIGLKNLIDKIYYRVKQYY